jgi:hypothetical protein
MSSRGLIGSLVATSLALHRCLGPSAPSSLLMRFTALTVRCPQASSLSFTLATRSIIYPSHVSWSSRHNHMTSCHVSGDPVNLMSGDLSWLTPDWSGAAQQPPFYFISSRVFVWASSILCLGLLTSFICLQHVLFEVLIIWVTTLPKSKFTLHPFELCLFSTHLNYTLYTSKQISLNDHVILQTSMVHRVHFFLHVRYPLPRDTWIDTVFRNFWKPILFFSKNGLYSSISRAIL